MPLPTLYSQFIHTSRYARWIEDEKRRETWEETVDRYLNFMQGHLQKKHDYSVAPDLQDELRSAILNCEVLPSMRALMTAGPALERDNIAGYNCSYIPIDDLRAFDEILYILTNGTGVGFSVESKYVSKLPPVPEEIYVVPLPHVVVVDDSKQGWAQAYRELIECLFDGYIPTWDVSQVRPAGARLKTFGGRASGPEPLVELFEFTIKVITNARGRQLTPLEAHEIACKIGEVVVVGGVRRSALLSLSDIEDDEMATAKNGEWWNEKPHLRLSNNSVAYTKKPTREVFWKEWNNLAASGSGERGVFNRAASKHQAGLSGRRKADVDFGTNPCSEIILRPNQFCNLSTVVVREYDNLESLRRKVRLATILGTFQATLTDFQYIRDIWTTNTEEERLLGVSLTGQMGHTILSSPEAGSWLSYMKYTAIQTNRYFSEAIGIPQAAAITCVKPEGTSSQLVGASSGMHTWYNDYFVRTVRADKKDPLTNFMRDAGIPMEDDVMSPDNTAVFSFPIKAPDGAVTRRDATAIQQLETWLVYQREWCEHKPSMTVYVNDDEWFEVGEWVWNHFDEISGLSFLPNDEHNYKQAPYQDIAPEEYDRLVEEMPKSIDWSILSYYEKEDTTVGSQTLNCSAGLCEVVDLTA